jgi:hypothetical protein
MANNPNIILGAGQGRPESVDYNSARNIVQAGAALQSKQEQQDRQQAMQAQQMFQTALQQTGGDYDQAVVRLRGQGINTLGIEADMAKQRKLAYDATKAHYDSLKSQHDSLSGYAAQIRDQASLDKARPLMIQTDPELDAMIPTVYAGNETTFRSLAGLGETGSKILETANKANDDWLSGKYQKGLYTALAGTTSDADVEGVRQAARAHLIPESMIQQAAPPGAKWSPGQVKSWEYQGLNLEKRADIAEKQADDARQATMDAETVKQHGIQNKFEQQRIGLEGARVGMERQKMQQGQALNTQAMTAANPNAPHGEEFLKSLQPNIAAQVKALDEGRMQFPSSFALKTPYWQQMLSAVAQYDPNFDQVNYNSRAATRKDFTSGKSAQQINAINTAIGHLSQLSDLADALHNKDWNTYNSIANSMMTEFGWTGKTDYDTVLGRVAPEITRVWRGTGGNESDIKRDIDTLNSSRAGGQIHGSIANLGDMLKSKIDSSAEQYAQGMGTKPVEMTTPQAAATLAKLSKRAGRSESSSAPAGYQVDQVVSVKGKPIKITKVNADGTFEGLPQ